MHCMKSGLAGVVKPATLGPSARTRSRTKVEEEVDVELAAGRSEQQRGQSLLQEIATMRGWFISLPRRTRRQRNFMQRNPLLLYPNVRPMVSNYYDIGVILGLYRDKGKENGNYYLRFRV